MASLVDSICFDLTNSHSSTIRDGSLVPPLVRLASVDSDIAFDDDDNNDDVGGGFAFKSDT